MRYTPGLLKWILRLYPPFLFQRIWVKKIHDGFTGADITIPKSFLNINSNKTIFGGTMFSSIDPIHTLLINLYLKKQGFGKTIAWLKSAHIQYKKPGRHKLKIQIRLSEYELQDILYKIRKEGKIVQHFTIEIYDRYDTLCAISDNEIYIRDLEFDFEKLNKTLENNKTVNHETKNIL